MAVPIKFVLLTCVVALAQGQYPNTETSGGVQRPRLPPAGGRFLPRPAVKNLHSSIPNQRFRRPIAIKVNRPTAESSDFPPLSARPKPTFVPAIKTESPSTPPPQSLQQDQPIKPVSEEIKEEDEDVNQGLVKLAQVSPTYPQSSANFVPSVAFTPKPEYRSKIHLPDEIITPVQYRPVKPVKPLFRKPVEEPEVRIKFKPKPEYREKKPVAQIIRRWREDNDDGSITWGFENDDGSYKEEMIGVDCVTRGKYGYVDPDGIRREYTYETGIKCDETVEDDESGFVDYQENKLVLANGRTIDLSNMGKNKSRRPTNFYRN